MDIVLVYVGILFGIFNFVGVIMGFIFLVVVGLIIEKVGKI